MDFLRHWRAVRAFNRLPLNARQLVFYSESGQDWHHFAPIIEQLLDEGELRLCYLSSDPRDPGLRLEHPQLHTFEIGQGWLRTAFFLWLRAQFMVMTMPDLHALQLKRSSVHPVHYIYLFHSLSSTHMLDRPDAYDHYDTILCAGPHQMDEIRRRETLHQLPAKQLLPHGYHRLEQLTADARQAASPAGSKSTPTLLLAPTWGEEALLPVCGEALIAVLLKTGYRVILRPHQQTVRSQPTLIKHLEQRFIEHPRFELETRMADNQSLLRAHALICDWSSMAVEYAFALERPVLSIDVPRRVRNPDYQALGLEPLEVRIREIAGTTLSPTMIDQAPAQIAALLANSERYRQAIAALREASVYHPGEATQAACCALRSLCQQVADDDNSPQPVRGISS